MLNNLSSSRKVRLAPIALLAITLLLVASMTLVGSKDGVTAHGLSQKVDRSFRKSQGANAITNQYIVVLKDNIEGKDVPALAEEFARTHGGKVGFIYQHALKGFSVTMPEASALTLSKESRVEFVEEDGIAGASCTDTTQFSPANWGLDRIDQRTLPLDSGFTHCHKGLGINAYVLDTGIRAGHDEFGNRAERAADFIGDGQNGKDCNGHGTHVAGILGGNTYGVAKKVKIFAVRILNCDRKGQTSGLIAGVDWVTANGIKPAVVNISVWSAPNDAVDTAIRNSISAGFVYVVLAGNGLENNNIPADAINVSPARVAEAITVSSTGIQDVRSSFANFGQVVDVFAPGEDIVSAWYTSNTATVSQSGTSMATPHVAGVAATYLNINPFASPAEVQQAIKNLASSGRVINPGPGTTTGLLYSRWP